MITNFPAKQIEKPKPIQEIENENVALAVYKTNEKNKYSVEFTKPFERQVPIKNKRDLKNFFKSLDIEH